MAKEGIETGMAESETGISRRDLLRRAAIVGGSVVWMAPAIQTLAPRAYADVSAGVSTCCQCVKTSGAAGGQYQCFANAPNADTLTKCTNRCAAFKPGGSNYTIDTDGFHQDFPAGSGKSFSCVAASPSGTKCFPVPH